MAALLLAASSVPDAADMRKAELHAAGASLSSDRRTTGLAAYIVRLPAKQLPGSILVSASIKAPFWAHRQQGRAAWTAL